MAVTNELGVTLERVKNAFEQDIDPADEAWVEDRIDTAARLLIRKVPALVARIVAGELDADFVKDKVVACVLRVLRNPEGLESEQEGNYDYKFRNLVASGDLWYTRDELNDLAAPDRKDQPRTVFSKATEGWAF